MLGLCTCKSGVQPAQKPCTERTQKNNTLTSLSLFFPCPYRCLPLGEWDSQPEGKGARGCSQHRSATRAKLRGEGKTICGGQVDSGQANCLSWQLASPLPASTLPGHISQLHFSFPVTPPPLFHATVNNSTYSHPSGKFLI